MTEQERRERLEIEFWAQSETESPDARSLDTFTNKMSEARIVLEKFKIYEDIFGSAAHVLELGGGQGWVSCMLGRAFPEVKRIVTSDISADAIASLPEWERVLGIEIDSGLVCRSYDIPVGDESFDLVFAFASAHHFGAHRRTLREISRVLRPGGHALYLHEPACPGYIYKRAVERVNRKRPIVQEDVLRYRRVAELAADAGLETRIDPAPTTTYRGTLETVYYAVLQKVPPLRWVLPCSMDFVFSKPDTSA